MDNPIQHVRKLLWLFAFAAAFVALPAASHAASSQGDLAGAVKAKLHGSEFKNVQVTADNNDNVTLTGTVPLYENKVDADRIAHKVKGVKGVDDQIQAGGAQVSDGQIEKTLGPELAFSRAGYGLIYDAIIMHVQNGVVTLSGHAHNYPDRDAAVGLAASTPGVREVIDDIQIDPPSPMDWQIRREVATAIYGYPALNKYAINPVRPIRIAVENGHVELYGTVDSAQDRQIAMMRAQTVPGIFEIKNYIQVQGQNEQQQMSNGQQNNGSQQR